MISPKRALRQAATVVGLDRAVKVRRVGGAGSVTIDNQEIPPASIRLGGHNFSADRDFLDAAVRDAQRLEKSVGLNVDSSILDIGCGVGRLPIGVRAHFGSIGHYTGIDVDAGSIAWCKKHITGTDVSFVHLDLANDRYNPKGKEIDNAFQLPFPARSFDIIHLYSVFSHMETGDVVAYLGEFERLLSHEGQVFLTAFVEDEVEDIAINPPGYGTFPGEWDGALHCVRFDREFFNSLVENAGLRIVRFDHASDTDGQSAIFLKRQ